MAKVNGKEAERFFKRAYLNGTIPECVAHTSKANITIQAIDLTNSLFVHVISPFKFEDLGELGIGQIDKLTKYLGGIAGDTEVEITREEDSNRLDFKGNGKFRFLLSSTDVITTCPQGEGTLDEILGSVMFTAPCDGDTKQKLLNYMNLVKCKTVKLIMNKRGAVKINGGLETEHQFEISLGRATTEGKNEIAECEVIISSDNFASVIQATYLSNDEVFIQFGNDPQVPVVVSQGTDHWAMMPVTGEE